MKKAAIYMRVSTAGQEDEETIENQEMELLKRIAKDDVVLLPEQIYKDDGWTGGTLERPDIDRLRSDAIDKLFEVLYIFDRGRLARPYWMQEVVIDELKKLGIEVISLYDLNPTNPYESVMAGMQGLFHEYERVKTAERMRIGKLRKVKEREKLLGYSAKYGYEYHPKVKTGKEIVDGHFTINERHAAVVRKMFNWADEGLTKYGIQKKLFEAGIKPPKGKRDIWCTSVIDRLLKDSTYCGEHFYNKARSVEPKNPRSDKPFRRTIKSSRAVNPRDEWMPVAVPAIISKEQFYRVKKLLGSNKKFNPKNKKHNYLVGGLVHCTCGYKRTGELGRFYRCNDRLNNAQGTRKCKANSVNSVVLDSTVWSSIEELLLQPEIITQQAKRWQGSNTPQLQEQLAELNKSLLDFEVVQNRYADAYGEGVWDLKQYQDKLNELSDKRNVVVKEIADLNGYIAQKPVLPLEKLVSGVVELVESLDFSNKQQIIQKLVTKVVATKEEVKVWGYIPITQSEKVGLNAKYRNRRVA